MYTATHLSSTRPSPTPPNSPPKERRKCGKEAIVWEYWWLLSPTARQPHHTIASSASTTLRSNLRYYLWTTAQHPVVNQTASTLMKTGPNMWWEGGKKDVTRVTRIKEVWSKEHTGLYAEILQKGEGRWANLGYFRKGGGRYKQRQGEHWKRLVW